MNERPMKILGIAGSLRSGSINRALLRAAEETAPSGVHFDMLDLAPLPLFNEDVESQGDPESVLNLKSAIRGSDLVLIATPEYNGGLPAALKNALDWGSRGKPQAWDGKPVAIMGATPGRGGTAGAQRALRECLSQLNAYVMPQPRLLVAGAGSVFDKDLRVTDEATKQRVQAFVASAAKWAQRMQ